MNRNDVKKQICSKIDEYREEIIAVGEDIWIHPELGFKEERTAEIVSSRFKDLGISLQTGLAVTGVKGILESGENRVTAAYLGEMDSVLVPDHPNADPVTGAAHACGHNAQVANLIALAYGLVGSGVMKHLGGNIALMAVPAEEYVEIAFRSELRKSGKIKFLGGKPELIRLGAFQDIQMTMMTHQSSDRKKTPFSVGGPSNGCLVKRIRYEGKAAHAGAAPHQGINALKAAMLGIQAIDCNRETFRDGDHIRVHPIVTRGGDLVNVVPSDVEVETYVRGASIEAIIEAAEKVDRCLEAGAMAMGAGVEIHTIPGYLPRLLNDDLADIYRDNVFELAGQDAWHDPEFGAGSTDMGDVSHILPAIEAQVRGTRGTGHGKDYEIDDPDTAYIKPAKAAAMTLVDLLWNEAEKARKVLQNFQPVFTREEYLAFLENLEKRTVWPR